MSWSEEEEEQREAKRRERETQVVGGEIGRQEEQESLRYRKYFSLFDTNVFLRLVKKKKNDVIVIKPNRKYLANDNTIWQELCRYKTTEEKENRNEINKKKKMSEVYSHIQDRRERNTYDMNIAIIFFIMI